MARIVAIVLILLPLFANAQSTGLDEIIDYNHLTNKPQFKGGDEQLEYLFEQYFGRVSQGVPNEKGSILFDIWIDTYGDIMSVHLVENTMHDKFNNSDTTYKVFWRESLKVWDIIKDKGWKFEKGIVNDNAVMYKRMVMISFDNCLQSSRKFVISMGQPDYVYPKPIGDYQKFDLLFKKAIFSNMDSYDSNGNLYVITSLTADSLLSNDIDVMITEGDFIYDTARDLPAFKEGVLKAIDECNAEYKWQPYTVNGCVAEMPVSFYMSLSNNVFHTIPTVPIKCKPEIGKDSLSYLLLTSIDKKVLKQEVVKSNVKTDIIIRVKVGELNKALSWEVMHNDYAIDLNAYLNSFFTDKNIWWYAGLNRDLDSLYAEVTYYEWTITYDEIRSFVKNN